MAMEYYDKDLDSLLGRANVRYVCKDGSLLMRMIGWLLATFRINQKFMTVYWTTIGNTVYFPTTVKNPSHPRYDGVRSHELMHVDQYEKYGVVLMAIAYLFFPLPFFLSGRWWIERRPYLEDIRAGRKTVDRAVNSLWSGYGWPYPRSWMRAWFVEQLGAPDVQEV